MTSVSVALTILEVVKSIMEVVMLHTFCGFILNEQIVLFVFRNPWSLNLNCTLSCVYCTIKT